MQATQFVSLPYPGKATPRRNDRTQGRSTSGRAKTPPVWAHGPHLSTGLRVDHFRTGVPWARFPTLHDVGVHTFLLLRDIAVNESDQGRVSDSGAIRSGLVPQLKHNAIHRRSPRLKRAAAWAPWFLAEALQPPVAGKRRASIGRTAGGCGSERRKISGSLALADATENVTPCLHWSPTLISPRYCGADRASITLAGSRCALLLRLPPRGPPLSVHRRSIAWSFSRDDVNRIMLVASERTAIAGRCSNCGFEMGVCRTWWKRVSCAQRDARAAQGAA